MLLCACPFIAVISSNFLTPSLSRRRLTNLTVIPSEYALGSGNGIIVSRTCNLGQNKWKTLIPLPPKSRMGKWRVFALRAASSLIWGGDGRLLFHFILSKIVAYYPRRPFFRFFYLILQSIYNTYLFLIVQVKTETLPHRQSEHLSEFHS